MKKIGIIIPAFNAENYITKCLDSILSQTFKNAQVIVINDFSTDNTHSILEKYKNRFLKCDIDYNIINLDSNEGQAACFNYAFKVLDSELFMWLDSDDFLYKDCFEKKVSFMDAHKDLDLCICDCDVYDYPNYETPKYSLSRNKSSNDYFEDVLKMNNVIWPPGSICVRTNYFFKKLKTKSIFPSREGQNIQLLLPTLYKSKYDYINKSLYGVVAHNNSHSRSRMTFKKTVQRQKNILIIYKKTLDNINGIEKKNTKLFYSTVKKVINYNIFKIYLSKRKIIMALYYFYKTDMKRKRIIIKHAFERAFH